MGGGSSRSDHSNSNNANSSRSDHSDSGNNNRVDRSVPGADRSNGGLSERRGQPNSPNSSKPDASGNAGSDMRTGKGRHDNSLTPNTNRDKSGDIAGHAKPGPTVKPTADSEETGKSHFHWFWRHSPKSPGETGTAKAVRPDLKRPTPCKGTNCKPVCPAGQMAGETGGCVPTVPIHANCNGTVDAHGNCIPNDPCASGSIVPGTNCPHAAKYQNLTDCSAAAAEAVELKNQIEILIREEQLVCSKDPNSPDCVRIRDELLRLQERLRQAQQQYASCMSRQMP
jgi:hypothetical protein